MPNIVIVIPTFNPGELLLSTLKDIDSYPELKVLNKIVVNDGPANKFISAVKLIPGLTVIDHGYNRGKGAAIKTAIRHIIETSPNTDYILTADSDGQHRGADIVSVFNFIHYGNEGLHIGIRQLDRSKTPLRSFLGNFLSRTIFNLLYNFELHDTQSGLRAYPRESFKTLVDLKYDHYEFEMAAIIALLDKKTKIFQTSVATVYFNKNRSSHFRPLKDSSRVIWVMLRQRLKIF